MDDYHAFMSTSGGGGGSGGGGTGCLPWILIGLAILSLIGKLG